MNMDYIKNTPITYEDNAEILYCDECNKLTLHILKTDTFLCTSHELPQCEDYAREIAQEK